MPTDQDFLSSIVDSVCGKSRVREPVDHTYNALFARWNDAQGHPLFAELDICSQNPTSFQSDEIETSGECKGRAPCVASHIYKVATFDAGGHLYDVRRLTNILLDFLAYYLLYCRLRDEQTLDPVEIVRAFLRPLECAQEHIRSFLHDDDLAF